MYNWVVFLHIFFAFGFILAHGVHAAVMLALRNEPDPERSLTFFNVVPQITLVRVLTVLMGITGVVAAIMTGWWRQGWTWASLVVFVVIALVMYRYGAGYFGMVYGAADRFVGAKNSGADTEPARKEFDEARASPNLFVVTVVGLLGLAIILWMMTLKPF